MLKILTRKIFNEVSPVPVKTKPWWKIGEKDYSFVSVNAGYPGISDSATSSDSKLDAADVGHNVYEVGEAKEIYKPIEGYEGSHRFDPHFKWDPEEEKRLIKTVSFITVSSLR
jgi:hypothetical protein